MFLGTYDLDDVVTFSVQTHNTSGVETDADAVPSFRVYEDETGTAIATGNMAKLDDANTTGFYSEQITLSSANGYERGKSYNIRITATVGGTTGSTIRKLRMNNQGRISANGWDGLEAMGEDYGGGGASVNANVTSIATDAIDAGAIAADAVTKIQEGLPGAVWDELVSDHNVVEGTFGYTIDEISGAAGATPADIADAVWDEAGSGHTTAGTFGAFLNRLHSIFTGITWLAPWLRAPMRSDPPDAQTLKEINNGGGTYDPRSQSLQAQVDD